MPFYLSKNHANRVPSNHMVVSVLHGKSARQGRGGWTDRPLAYWSAKAFTLRDGKAGNSASGHGHDPGPFWELVAARAKGKVPLWVWFHHLERGFTALGGWHLMDRGRLKAKVAPKVNPDTGKAYGGFEGFLCLEAQPRYAKLSMDGKRVNFVDPMNYFPVELSGLTDGTDAEELSEPPDGMDHGRCKEWCGLAAYTVMGTVVELLVNWEASDVGCFQMTAGSCAFHAWRHMAFEPDEQGRKLSLMCDDDQRANDWERAGFFGGRIEPFYYGKSVPMTESRPTGNVGRSLPDINTPWGWIHEVDICGMYPSVMAGRNYPCRRIAHGTEMHPDDLQYRTQVDGAMAWVEIETDYWPYPVRTPRGLIHAVGRFVTMLCGDELRAALARGHVKQVLEYKLYAMAPLFKRYVETWYAERRTAEGEGDRMRGLFAKLMLNSLFGKFAQRGTRWMDEPDAQHPSGERWGTWLEREGTETVPFRTVAGNGQAKRKAEDPSWAFPAVSAFVTANARQYLAEVMDGMPKRSILYVHTDAFFTTDEGLAHLRAKGLMTDHELGKFRLVDTHAWIEINGVNDLRLPTKWIKAGVPLDTQTRSANGWTGEVWQSLPGVLANCPTADVQSRLASFTDAFDVWKNKMGADRWALPHVLDKFTDD